MANFGYQMQRTEGGTINNGSAITFNSLLVDYDSNISYNEGTFTIAKEADYFVSWFVTTKTGLGIAGPDIQLIVESETPISYSSTNSMKTGQISGSAVVKGSDALTFKLINNTGQAIVLADNVNVRANISIVQINHNTSGIELQLINENLGTPTEIAGGAVIPFNHTFSSLDNSITNTLGSIHILSPGKYIADFSVSLAGSLNVSSFKFELVNTDSSACNIIGVSENPVVAPGTIYGTALFNVKDATAENPYTIQLLNKSTASSSALTEITLADIGIQASIRIVEI